MENLYLLIFCMLFIILLWAGSTLHVRRIYGKEKVPFLNNAYYYLLLLFLIFCIWVVLTL